MGPKTRGPQTQFRRATGWMSVTNTTSRTAKKLWSSISEVGRSRTSFLLFGREPNKPPLRTSI
jgi:hypothetical protein